MASELGPGWSEKEKCYELPSCSQGLIEPSASLIEEPHIPQRKEWRGKRAWVSLWVARQSQHQSQSMEWTSSSGSFSRSVLRSEIRITPLHGWCSSSSSRCCCVGDALLGGAGCHPFCSPFVGGAALLFFLWVVLLPPFVLWRGCCCEVPLAVLFLVGGGCFPPFPFWSMVYFSCFIQTSNPRNQQTGETAMTKQEEKEEDTQ